MYLTINFSPFVLQETARLYVLQVSVLTPGMTGHEEVPPCFFFFNALYVLNTPSRGSCCAITYKLTYSTASKISGTNICIMTIIRAFYYKLMQKMIQTWPSLTLSRIFSQSNSLQGY